MSKAAQSCCRCWFSDSLSTRAYPGLMGCSRDVQLCAEREVHMEQSWREQEDGTYTLFGYSVDDQPAPTGNSSATSWREWLHPSTVHAQVGPRVAVLPADTSVAACMHPSIPACRLCCWLCPATASVCAGDSTQHHDIAPPAQVHAWPGGAGVPGHVPHQGDHGPASVTHPVEQTSYCWSFWCLQLPAGQSWLSHM